MKKGIITLVFIGLVALAGTASAGWFGHNNSNNHSGQQSNCGSYNNNNSHY